jgi:uncharacterized protein YuzE
MIRLNYDLDAGALYIKLSDRAVHRTRDVDDNTAVDVADDGSVVGIEVISVTHPWALSSVLASFQITAADAAQLRAYFLHTPVQAKAMSPQSSPTQVISHGTPAPQWSQDQEPRLSIESRRPLCAV